MVNAQDTHQIVTLIIEHVTNAHRTVTARIYSNQSVIMEGALKVRCQNYLPDLEIQTFE